MIDPIKLEIASIYKAENILNDKNKVSSYNRRIEIWTNFTKECKNFAPLSEAFYSYMNNINELDHPNINLSKVVENLSKMTKEQLVDFKNFLIYLNNI